MVGADSQGAAAGDTGGPAAGRAGSRPKETKDGVLGVYPTGTEDLVGGERNRRSGKSKRSGVHSQRNHSGGGKGEDQTDTGEGDER